ncbi:transposase, partial [Achromobacter sp. SIMBA_011]|uniref:transposase n=1 Tax=Achromobacter sp. SIMBA_011 TaxID=3085759 RepID=UPI00397CD80E
GNFGRRTTRPARRVARAPTDHARPFRAWLARHTRYHMHFTPTYSSWLNQVERWFGLITQQAIRRGSFKNVRQLIASI